MVAEVVAPVAAVFLTALAVPDAAVGLAAVDDVRGRAEDPRLVRSPDVEVRDAVEPEAVTGLRAAAVLVAPGVVFLSVVLPGLDMMELVLLAAAEVMVDFRSSSLALTLGLLRWLETEPVVVRRVAVVEVVGGRVGGLLRPPLTRAAVPVPVEVPLEAFVAAVAEPRRRAAAAAVVVVAPARFAAAVGLAVPLVLTGVRLVSGPVFLAVGDCSTGVASASSATGWVSSIVEAGSSDGAVGVSARFPVSLGIEVASSGWITSKLSFSDIMR